MQIMNSTIPNLFKKTRKLYGKSQKEFADLIGVSRVAISMYETGKTEPKAEKYIRVLMLYNAANGKKQ